MQDSQKIYTSTIVLDLPSLERAIASRGFSYELVERPLQSLFLAFVWSPGYSIPFGQHSHQLPQVALFEAFAEAVEVSLAAEDDNESDWLSDHEPGYLLAHAKKIACQ